MTILLAAPVLLIGLTAVAVGAYLLLVVQQRLPHSDDGVAEVFERLASLTVEGFTARKATPSDVDRIIEAMDQRFLRSNGWSHATYSAAVAQLRRTTPDRLGYITVCHGEAAIGWATIGEVSSDRDRCSLGFGLHPSARSRGLGAGALNVAVQALHHAGVRTIEIGTRTSNGAMVSCIESTGAVRVRQAPRVLPDGSETMSLYYEHTADR